MLLQFILTYLIEEFKYFLLYNVLNYLQSVPTTLNVVGRFFTALPRICIIMNEKIDVFIINTEDPFLGDVLGCDIRIIDPQATVADLMDALDGFAADHLADCKGCDGCCQERAPLLSADVPALARKLPSDTAWPAHAVVASFGLLRIDDGASDVMLRRDADGVCAQLDRENRCCTIWPQRPFVCRSHFCMPRSFLLEQLRQDIANLGLNELTRLLLAEEANGAPPLDGVRLSERLNGDDYQPNAFSGKSDYHDILLKDCVDPELWKELCSERKGC